MVPNEFPIRFTEKSFANANLLYNCGTHDILTADLIETGEKLILFKYNYQKTTKDFIKKIVESLGKINKLSHKSLLPVYGYIIPKVGSQDCFYLIYKQTAKGCLASIIDDIKLFPQETTVLQPKQVVMLIYGIAAGLRYLHKNNIIDGELQPYDIFLDEDYRPSIANYGIILENPVLKNPEFLDIRMQMCLAPEMYKVNVTKMSFASDVYSFAMLCFRILSKKNVFDRNASSVSFAENIVKGHRLKIPPYIYPFLSNLIELCWAQNPEERPSANKIVSLLKEGIVKFTPKLDKVEFKEYCDKLEEEDSLSDHNDESDTSSSREARRESDSSSIEFSPLKDNQEDFYIPIKKLKNTKYSKEYKDLKKIKTLNISERANIVKALMTQELLLNLTKSKLQKTIEWFLANINFSNLTETIIFTKNLFNTIKLRFKNIPVYGLLMMGLNKANSFRNKTTMIKNIYKTILFSLMLNSEPLPSLSSNIALLKQCCEQGVYKYDEIVDDIREFFYNQLNTKRQVCLIFGWFAKEIFKRDRKLFDDILEVFEKNSQNPYFLQEYTMFFNDLDIYLKNDWEKFTKKSLLQTRGSILDAIYNDDLEKIIGIIKKEGFKCSAKIMNDLYETCSIVNSKPSFIMYAAVYGAESIFQFLKMKIGANIFFHDAANRTLPVFAAAGGSTTIMRLSDQVIGDSDGALQAAIEFNQKDVYNFLVSKKGNNNLKVPDRNGKLPMVVAAESNNIYAMVDMLKRGVSPSVCEVFDITPLHAAAAAGNIEATRLLINLSDVDVNACNSWGVTALHAAADKCQYDTMKILLGHKSINVNARTEALKTPLHVAVESGFHKTVALLLSHKNVDINAVDSRGSTALHKACKLKNYRIIELLLMRSDINLDIRNTKGKTPYGIATEMYDQRTMSIFEMRNRACRI